jgi:hypothetical protein
MIPGDFNWFLHTMMFYHTQHVIKKQMKTSNGGGKDGESDEE